MRYRAVRYRFRDVNHMIYRLMDATTRTYVKDESGPVQFYTRRAAMEAAQRMNNQDRLSQAVPA